MVTFNIHQLLFLLHMEHSSGILEYSDQIQLRNKQLFDPVRKLWVNYTPEEQVRQCVILWLHDLYKVPFGRMAVEKSIKIFKQTKRFDLVVFDDHLTPRLLVECKQPNHPILQKIFEQAALYNLEMKAPYLAITNGIHWLLAEIDFGARNYQLIKQLPDYPF